MVASQGFRTGACLVMTALLLAAAAPLAGAGPLEPPRSPAELHASGHRQMSGGDQSPRPLLLSLAYTDELGVRGLSSSLVAWVLAPEQDLPDTKVVLEAEDVHMQSPMEVHVDLRAGEPATVRFEFLVLTPGDHFVAVTATNPRAALPTEAYRQGWIEAPAVPPAPEDLLPLSPSSPLPIVGRATFRADQPRAPEGPGDALPLHEEPQGTGTVEFEHQEPAPFVPGPSNPREEAAREPSPNEAQGVDEDRAEGEAGLDGGNTFQVTGCWHYREAKTWFRQRWATWEVWDEDPNVQKDDLLASGITGGNGCFTTPSLPRYESGSNPQDLYVIFYSCNGAVCVMDEGTGHSSDDAYSWTTPGTVSADAVGDVWNLGNQQPQAQHYAGRLFQYTNNAYAWAIDFAGFTADELDQVEVLSPTSLGPCMCDEPLASTHLYIPADGKNDTEPDTVSHEYGHWAMWKVYGYIPGPSGEHSWCDQGQHPGLAWSEGFAHFFATRANFDLVQSVNVPVPGADGDTRYSSRNLETESCGAGPLENEMKVARTLWDLRDSADDGFDWGQWSMKNIMSLVRSCNSDHFREYYDAAGCSWADAGYNKCLFLRAAYQNDYDFNLRPLIQQITAPTGGGWVRGDKFLAATVDQTDSECDTTVSFYASLNDTCTTQDPLVDTSTSGFFGTWDTTEQDDGKAYYVCARADDTMEDDWDRTAAKFQVDNADPLLSLDLAGNAGNDNWFRSPVGVSLTCTDAHSGVASKQLNLDNQGYAPYTGGKLVFGQGFHNAAAICNDHAGNSIGDVEVFGIDSIDPGTILIASPPQGDDGWYLGTATLTLTCFDPPPGSGCAETQWSQGPNFLQPYTQPIKVNGPGTHTIHYRSLDVAGNVEDQHDYQVRIDPTPPVLEIQLAGDHGGNNWWVTNVQVTLVCNDAVSGVKPGSIKYRLDNGPLVPYVASFTLATQGYSNITATCADVAGNNDNAYAALKIDTKKPVTSRVMQGTLGQSLWYRSSVQVTLSCQDQAPGSACAIIRYELDNGGVKIYNGPFTVSAQGFHQLTYYAQDGAANTEALHVVGFGVDTSGPQVAIGLSGTNGQGDWWKSAVNVTLGCSDALSGGDGNSLQVSVAYGPFTAYAGPFGIAAQGSTEVDAVCYDLAGNIGSKTRFVLIDSAVPIGALVAEQKEDLAVLSWTAQDVTSGIAVAVLVEQSFAGGPFVVTCATWETGTGPIEGACEQPMDDQGEYCWRLNIEDVAGHNLVSAPQCITHITPG